MTTVGDKKTSKYPVHLHSLPNIPAGTYNNQYMVLDRSKVKLGHSIDDGALTVVEQIPGLVEYSDQTQALRRGNAPSVFVSDAIHLFDLCSKVPSLPSFDAGHWPSYNIPFHQNIYTLSGYGEMWREYGEDFSYDLCPRAKIFRRDQADVKDLDSLKHIMRFNGELLRVTVSSISVKNVDTPLSCKNSSPI